MSSKKAKRGAVKAAKGSHSGNGGKLPNGPGKADPFLHKLQNMQLPSPSRI